LRLAEQRKAELAAAKKREDDERRAREAEAEQKAKAAAAELAAAKKREEDERRAKAAEAEQKAKVLEAERKAAEAKQKAEQAEKDRVAAEAAAQRAASEKQTREAERQAAEAKQKAEQEAAAARAASEKQAREAEAARRKAELAAAKESACKSEQGKFEELAAKGSEGSGIDDLKAFSRTVTCDRLGSLVVATLDKFNAEAAKRAAALPNSPELVRSAQTQLVRLGCLTGKIDGTLNTPTKSALGRYLSIRGQPTENASVTEAVVAELTKHATRVCPIECKTGETLKGETCIADEKPTAAPATASRKNVDEDDARPRRKQSSRAPEREARRARPMPEAPRARQQAVARPSIVSGGGGGGHSTMIGVGF
jgi:hypothetical protein